jgi:putative endonuclease
MALLKQSFFMSHFVYILQSLKDSKYYIGETSDVEARLCFHNAGLQRSTKHRRPFKIVLIEVYAERVWHSKGRNKLNVGKEEYNSENRLRAVVPHRGTLRSGRRVAGSSRLLSGPVCPTVILMESAAKADLVIFTFDSVSSS